MGDSHQEGFETVGPSWSGFTNSPIDQGQSSSGNARDKGEYQPQMGGHKKVEKSARAKARRKKLPSRQLQHILEGAAGYGEGDAFKFDDRYNALIGGAGYFAEPVYATADPGDGVAVAVTTTVTMAPNNMQPEYFGAQMNAWMHSGGGVYEEMVAGDTPAQGADFLERLPPEVYRPDSNG